MASCTMNKNLEASKVFRSIRAKVPPPTSSSSSSSSSSSLSPIPKKLGKRGIDYCPARFLMQNHANFNKSRAPVRFMFYQKGMWMDFSRRLVDSLRSVFSERNSVVEMTIEGSSHLFDFLRMLQIDLGTGNQRSIAWIDEDSKCFFPKQFIEEEFGNTPENPKIEIQINGISEPKFGERMREVGEMKGEANDEVTSSFKHGDGAKRRRLEPSKLETPRWPNVRLLREGDGAYTIVKNVFLPGFRKIHSGATITAIHQCTRVGPLEKARREIFYKQMEITKNARGTSNTVYAWYGASAQGIAGVLTHGFGVTKKLSGSDANGVGVFLSPLAYPCRSSVEAEADDNGEKHLILCRVILGNVEKVEAGFQQCYPSSSEFDTGADNPKNPKWYLVWSTNMSRHILPECVMSYKSSDRLPAELGSLTRTKYTFPELFSKIKSSLPPVKVQECITLYEALKARKITKDLFIMQFRLIAGEKVLLSAIREICGAE